MDGRRQKLEDLRLSGERKRSLKNYVEGLNNFEGDDLETSLYAFVNHPDFHVIYNQTNTIGTSKDKWAFILRKAYEIGQEVHVTIGHEFQAQGAQAKKALEDYGIYLLCPYCRSTDREKHPKNDCIIDGEPIMSLCEGLYEQCVIFQDRAVKAAIGDIKLPEATRQIAKINIPKIDVDSVDLQDLDDWWRMEGKYN